MSNIDVDFLVNICVFFLSFFNVIFVVRYFRLLYENNDLLSDNYQLACAISDYEKASGVNIFEYLKSKEVIIDDENDVITL